MGEELVLLFDRACPYTTGVYIERAAKKKGMRVNPVPFAGGMPVGEYLATCIVVDDGSPWDEGMAQCEKFAHRCFWAIDTHVAFERILEIARHFPLVYAAQHDGTEALRAEGVNAHWLPVAAEPEGWHRDLGVERDIDVAFVGNIRTPARQELMRLVDAAFDRFVVEYDHQLIQLIHDYGCLVITHCHGRLDQVLEKFLETGTNGLHPVEAPPMGDVTLAEAKRRVGGRICLVGNIQIGDIFRSTPEEMAEICHQVIREAGAGGGLILAASATPYERPLSQRTLRNFMSLVRTGRSFKG